VKRGGEGRKKEKKREENEHEFFLHSLDFVIVKEEGGRLQINGTEQNRTEDMRQEERKKTSEAKKDRPRNTRQ
jgi:hypothetical protein